MLRQYTEWNYITIPVFSWMGGESVKRINVQFSLLSHHVGSCSVRSHSSDHSMKNEWRGGGERLNGSFAVNNIWIIFSVEIRGSISSEIHALFSWCPNLRYYQIKLERANNENNNLYKPALGVWWTHLACPSWLPRLLMSTVPVPSLMSQRHGPSPAHSTAWQADQTPHSTSSTAVTDLAEHNTLTNILVRYYWRNSSTHDTVKYTSLDLYDHSISDTNDLLCDIQLNAREGSF